MNTSIDKEIALIIPAYNRYDSFHRLLNSVAQLLPIDCSVDLILSMEGYAVPNVIQCAEQFSWHLGDKHIIRHSNQLGLREHILACGNLSEHYEHVIIVEDDLYLSPFALEFAYIASRYYESETNIAGLSLYAPAFSETALRPFVPEHTKYDGYFMQQASSWGQVWSQKQWNAFVHWYRDHLDYDFEKSKLPWNIKLWPGTSWKRYFMAFLYETGKYIFYPKVSLSTNFSETGTHQRSNTRYQVCLQTQKIDYRFPRLSHDSLKYDIFYERHPAAFADLIPSTERLIIDLYGTKPIDEYEIGSFLLSSRVMDLNLITSYGLKLKPHEKNVMHQISGEQLFLYEINQCLSETAPLARSVSQLELIYWSGLNPDLLKDASDMHLIRAQAKHLDDLIFFKYLRIKMWIRALKRLLRRISRSPT